MPTTPKHPSWHAAHGCRRGKGHVANGTPCQDAALARGGRRAFAIVCDGRGSAAHSHLGSTHAVRRFAQLLRDAEPILHRVLDHSLASAQSEGLWRRFAHIANALQADQIEYVATEAVRRAANGAEFLAAAERAIGQPVTVLSGHEEAHTAGMGIAYSFHEPHGVVGDLGGGGGDLSMVTPEGPTAPYGSLPIGTLPVTRMMLEEPAAATRFIDGKLATLPWLAGAARPT